MLSDIIIPCVDRCDKTFFFTAGLGATSEGKNVGGGYAGVGKVTWLFGCRPRDGLSEGKGGGCHETKGLVLKSRWASIPDKP